MELRSHLAKARGLGSTKAGLPHWWAQRLTAVALVPLGLWFVFAALSLVGADHAALKAWVGHHGNALLLVLFTAALFHHAQLGVQVVVEDYVHAEWVKVSAIFAGKLLAAAAGASCVLAVFRLAYGS
jgi:succinate dehydrogenase / fumarate reductase membrane anchor subunit